MSFGRCRGKDWARRASRLWTSPISHSRADGSLDEGTAFRAKR